MEHESSREPLVTDLLRMAMDDARELVRAEVLLAKDEVGTEAKHAGASLFLLLLGVAIAAFALAGLVIGLLTAAQASPTAIALVFALIMAALAGISLFSARRLMPKHLLERTRGRVEDDIRRLKEVVQ